MSFEKVPFKLLLISSIVSLTIIAFLINSLISFYPSKSSIKIRFSILKVQSDQTNTTLTLDKNIEYYDLKNANFPFPKSTLIINGQVVEDYTINENIVKLQTRASFSKNTSLILKVYPKSNKNLLKVLIARY